MALLERRRPLWLLGVALACVLALAGCGSAPGGGAAPQGHAGHVGHDPEATAAKPIDLPAGAKAPRLTLTATPDPMGGFNLRVGMANFRLALRVEAVANNHAPYRLDGEPVVATAVVQAG